MMLKHECPECTRMVPVSTYGNWYSHQRGDAPEQLCPNSAQHADGRQTDPDRVRIARDDLLVEVSPSRWEGRGGITHAIRGDEESVSVKSISGGLPGSRR